MSAIEGALFARVLTDLLEETHIGAPNPKATWLVTNEPDSGFVGTLQGVTAEEASTPPAPGMNTIAAHAAHLRFALSLANRAFRGEDAYSTADWAGSWRTQRVDVEAWSHLRDELRGQHAQLVAAIRERESWDDAIMFQGTVALVGHAAYHLGAIRQIRRVLTATRANA